MVVKHNLLLKLRRKPGRLRKGLLWNCVVSPISSDTINIVVYVVIGDFFLNNIP